MKTKTKRISLGYGRGGVEQLASGAWRWQLRTGGASISLTRDTLPEAMAAAEATLVQGSKPTAPGTVAEACEGWRRIAERGRKGATVAGYRWATDVIVADLGTLRVVDLTRAQLRQVLGDWTERFGAGSIAKLRSALGRVLEYAVDAGWIATSPMPRRTEGAPQGRRETPHLSPTDMAAVRRHLVGQHSTVNAAFLAMLLTGMRPGEARAVQWDAIDLGGAKVHVCRSVERGQTKGVEHVVDGVKTSRYGDEGDRWLPLPPDLVAVLRRERDEQRRRGQVTPFAFAGPDGRHLSSYVMEHGATAIAKATGTRLVTPNGYRHTFLSMLADSGLPAATRKRLAGHRPHSTVLEAHYTHDMRGDDVDTTPYLGAVVELPG